MDRIGFRYEDGQSALEDIAFSVAPGEKVALVGPNGAGKSTLLHILAALFVPSEGSGEIMGAPMTKKELARARKHVGLLFQDPDDQIFMPTVWEDLAFGPINMGLSETEIRQRVAEAMAMTGITSFSERVPHHLSLGEKKRVAMAGLLAMSPSILLLDEPTANLDPQGRHDLINILKSRKETLILGTHDLSVAMELTERVIVLKKRIIFDGDFRSLVENGQVLAEAKLELPSFARLMMLYKERTNLDIRLPLSVEEALDILMRKYAT